MRYFIFFFSFNSSTKHGNGSVWLKNLDEFPSNQFIKEQASKGQEFNERDVAVTGWKELNKDDFFNFVGGDQ
jgi:hypothetical protein